MKQQNFANENEMPNIPLSHFAFVIEFVKWKIQKKEHGAFLLNPDLKTRPIREDWKVACAQATYSIDTAVIAVIGQSNWFWAMKRIAPERYPKGLW